MDLDLNGTGASSQQTPDLPRLYELVALESVDCVLQEACRRAAAGADEGLLVQARTQTEALGRRGQPWDSPAGGLYAALLLRPDEPPAIAAQLALVGAVALGAAVAEHVLPLTELHYRWPNDLLLRQGKAGTVQLAWSEGNADRPGFLVLGVYLNVSASPAHLGFEAASVQMEGESTATAHDLLEAFARQFLVAVDRWANEGFEPVRKTWLQRAVQVGEDVEIVAAKKYAGRLLDIADDGSALLAREGAVQRIPLSEAFPRAPSCVSV